MKHLIIGTAGHVDHGKTALIKALTGIECDTHKAEKERGITINLGFAHLELSHDLSCSIVDVPGHKDFIKTMVAGVHGIDMVLLVIAADSGIMPQTREHLQILGMLGIRNGIIVLNKADLVDNEMLEMAKLEALELVEGTVFEQAPLIAVSAVTGTGIDHLRMQIEHIAADIPQRNPHGRFRMYIDRVFNVKGIGIVVTGSVLQGAVNQGSVLRLLPGNFPELKVKGIQRHGKTVQKAAAGDRAAINLSGVRYADFERGMLLADTELPARYMLDAQVELFPAPLSLGVWSNVLFQTGTFTSSARMHLITSDQLHGGEQAVVQLHLEKPAILIKSDRFIIRNSSNEITIGGGMILDEAPLHHRRRTEKLKTNLQQLQSAMTDGGKLSDLIAFEVRKANKPVLVSTLAEDIGKNAAEIFENLIKNNSGIQMYDFGEDALITSEEWFEKTKMAIPEELAASQKDSRVHAKGLNLREIAGKIKNLGQHRPLELLLNVLDQLVKDGLIEKSDELYSLKGVKPGNGDKTAAGLAWLEAFMNENGLKLSSISEIEKFALREKITKAQLLHLLKQLASNGSLLMNMEESIHINHVKVVRSKLLQKLAKAPNGINEKEFRLLFDGTKRQTQLLLHHFEKEGLVEKKTFYLHITAKGKAML